MGLGRECSKPRRVPAYWCVVVRHVGELTKLALENVLVAGRMLSSYRSG